jgi:hypothetical protein
MVTSRCFDGKDPRRFSLKPAGGCGLYSATVLVCWYHALAGRGYKFTFKDAKKVLGIRLCKMLGVQSLGERLFQAK